MNIEFELETIEFDMKLMMKIKLFDLCSANTVETFIEIKGLVNYQQA